MKSALTHLESRPVVVSRHLKISLEAESKTQATLMRTVSVALVFVTAAVSAVHRLAAARPQDRKTKTVAQGLVEEALARHPEADEVGISAYSSRGCRTIASTDPGDIGEACERDDSEPMRSGKPYVEKEKDGFDISVPLHDSAGRLIGTVGIGFKPRAGQTEAAFVAQAQKIAGEIEAHVSSKAKLFERMQ